MAGKLLPIWTKHIVGTKEKQDFAKYVLNSGALLDRLDSILDELTAELDRAAYAEDYTSPAWPFLQADRLGQLKSFAKIKKLLNRKPND